MMNLPTSIKTEKERPQTLDPNILLPKKRHIHNKPTDDCIKVYCRIRPIDQEEEHNGGISVIHSEHTMVLLNDDCSRPISKKYSFTQLFQNETQDEIIRKLCDPILFGVKDESKGGLIFTYGVTNSGKTHTVLGTDKEPGILQYLFEKLPKPFKLLPVEVYNDEFYPLVPPRVKIHLIESAGVMEFKDFQPIEITDHNLQQILKDVKHNRSQRNTNYNSKSSRSHAIFRIQSQGQIIGVVDLAGSERVRQGCSHEETTNINRSLLTLGRCITCLRESRHDRNILIPFRESRLTMALVEYFSPAFKLTMVVNINPSKSMINETVNVLEYAAIARDIKPLNTPAKSRYKNINNSHNKMLVTLEETKSEDFDFYKKNQVPPLKRLQSTSKSDLNRNVGYEQGNELAVMRDYIIKNNLLLLKKQYYEKHTILNNEFNSNFERQIANDNEYDQQMLQNIKEFVQHSVRKQQLSQIKDTVPAAPIEKKSKRLCKPNFSKQVDLTIWNPNQELDRLNPKTEAQHKNDGQMHETSQQPCKMESVENEPEVAQHPNQSQKEPSISENISVLLVVAEYSHQQEHDQLKIANTKLHTQLEQVKTRLKELENIIEKEEHVPAKQSSNEPLEHLFKSNTKPQPGLFQRIVMSPYHSIKKGVKKVWEKLSPAKSQKKIEHITQKEKSPSRKSSRSVEKKHKRQSGESNTHIPTFLMKENIFSNSNKYENNNPKQSTSIPISSQEKLKPSLINGLTNNNSIDN